MPRDSLEVRILTRRRPDGKTEVSLYDPKNHREVTTGLAVTGDTAAVDKELTKVAEQLKRAGNRVTSRRKD